jgi:periplasmic copper chaperone A
MKRLGFALLLLLFVLPACTPAAQGITVGSIEIISPWVMAADNGSNTAAFMLLKNTGSDADQLVKVEFADAMETEIHETKMKNDVMEMSPVAAVEIPAKGQVELKSGSYHVMIMGLTKELKAGEKVNVTLTFAKAGSVAVAVEVRNP